MGWTSPCAQCIAEKSSIGRGRSADCSGGSCELCPSIGGCYSQGCSTADDHCYGFFPAKLSDDACRDFCK